MVESSNSLTKNTMETRFVAANNVGKLARWLRVIGYDTLLFKQKNDNQMIEIALSENRLILTKDTQLMKRRLVTSGRLKAMIVKKDDPIMQLKETVKNLNLDYFLNPFTLCIECNRVLIYRSKEDVQSVVPPHVFTTQDQYMECPTCHRIYWRGTHWQAMIMKLHDLKRSCQEGREEEREQGECRVAN